MPVPDFSPGEVLTAGAMDSIGMWKVTTANVTSGGSFTISNCFTSDYTNYRIVISNLKSSTSASLFLRLRSGATDSSTGYQYGHAYILFSSAAWITAAATNANSWVAPGNTSTSPPSNGVIDIFQPALAVQTSMTGLYQSFDASIFTTGSHTATTAYDGFSMVSGGTFTSGTITVYGYRK
jgi:hypothetical protein